MISGELFFEEFYEADLPKYAILSHRWGRPEDEWSYERFLAIEDLWSVIEDSRQDAPGLTKILQFCNTAKLAGYEWCWVDTCCIDKRSSAELTEAINAMYSWYGKAEICFAYLEDVNSKADFSESSWFTRGWTLQELLAPPVLHFYNRHWQPMGDRIELKVHVSRSTGIDEALLERTTNLEIYNVAQKMSWASSRQTSRVEDQAYCLLGLFGVNMPLLYGEGIKAFRRLQEAILEKGGDNSLFVWNIGENSGETVVAQPSLLAKTPSDFRGCDDVKKGFHTQRILFELTNRGMMLLIHRSYDRKTLDAVLNRAREVAGKGLNSNLVLTVPLGCYKLVHRPQKALRPEKESIFLQLVDRGGRWHRMGVVQHFDARSSVDYIGPHYLAYTNDYVRIYIQHDWDLPQDQEDHVSAWQTPISIEHLSFLHLRDAFDPNIDYKAR